MNNKLIDIIIISYAANDYCKEITENCINSILISEENIKKISNIIVVESESNVKWEYLSNNIHTYEAPLPYGYHKFLNFGRKKGNAPWVALCNNDLFFHKNWFSEIIKASKLFPDVLSFSPICPHTQPLYGININTGYYKGYNIRKEISGWCIVQKREIYNKIGDLDENFYHWYCDNDYAMTLMSNNIPHILVTSSIVEHHNKNIGKTTEQVIKTEEELYRLTNGSYSIFINKWKNYLKQ